MRMGILAVAVLAALGGGASPSSPSPMASPDPSAILDRAIKAAGGEERLRHAAVLKWRGRAVIHAGEQPVRLEGRWIVEPPDRAVVATWETAKGESSTRRLILLGSEGWMERGGTRTPMPAAILANERDQFYLYSLMRLLPLRDAGSRPTATGPRSLRVEREGRPTVEMIFDLSGRLDRMKARIANPGSGDPIAEEITLEGAVTGGGIAWPLRFFVTQDGAPFFDLELTEFGVGTSEELTREAGRK